MNQFKERFEKDYIDIDYFMDSLCKSNAIPYNGRLVEDNSDDTIDSYRDRINNGIERIYYFADFDIYIKFNGKYSSYYGETWFDYEEVKPVTKTITLFKTI